MPKIKLEGMEKLQVKLKKNVQMSDVKRVVKEMVLKCKKKCREKQISRRVIRPEQQKEVSG